MAVMYEGYQLASVSVLHGDKEAFSSVWVKSKRISLGGGRQKQAQTLAQLQMNAHSNTCF